MKLTAVDGDTPFLPEEIIRNILTRLPVKSLIRFQCVCKHWKKLIKTDSAIAEHLHHSTNENPLLLLQSDFRCDPLHLFMLNNEMQVLEIQSSPVVDSLRYARIVGCSNGLLCVSTGYGAPLPFLPSLFLWNPATREIRQVPRIMHDDIDSNYDLFAFGFSPIVNDYKIVVSHETAFDSEDDLVVEVIVELGGLGKDDVIEWIIVSFDIATEVFTLIPQPTALSDRDLRGSLTVHQNQLAILF
ncbi:F-box/kelch-repeat protein At3g23880-like [Prosopis cineraria]|uniref:F-box/kelch-repeat protein At3g23880-like n=1 Tax=Prosopis cineraria TaxID=364024 RepID=UPI00240ECD8E|nr:F-box/kelch-repeat protein At3g23880-like [Prosopis cineraria]